MTPQTNHEPLPPNVVHGFYPPSLRGIGYELGYRNGDWYLVYCRAYGMAHSYQISRLSSSPGRRNKLVLANGHHCFLLDNTDQCPGGEPWNHGLLQELLEVQDPPVVAVKGMSSSTWSWQGEPQYQVEVLLLDGQIAHCCEGCERWEFSGDGPENRHRELEPGRYLCENCDESPLRSSLALCSPSAFFLQSYQRIVRSLGNQRS